MLTNVFLLLAVVAVFWSFYSVSSDPVVMTTCGPVLGISRDGAFSFRGIPYAVPPVGDKRWRRPEGLSMEAGTCWKGTFPATQYGNTCYQRNPFNRSEYVGSEDCLVLNVWTPGLAPSELKPVMVWITGGSLQQSNANWPLYSPTEALGESTDIVYVGMNYRLQAFGFMALQMLADDSDTKTSGNYGFLDMLEALKWVQDNIQQFGGDPNQVTLFGQSSGGTAMVALLASPLSEGLFHKAWMLSASPVFNKTAADAYRDNEIFLKNTRCNDVNCLRALTSAEVTSAVPWDVYPYWAMSDQSDLPVKNHFDGAICIVDGYMLQDPPFVAWEKGHVIDVPLLIGTTANEVDFDPTYLDMNTWSWDQYELHVKTKLGTFGKDIVEEALSMYPKDHISPEFQFTSITSDIRVNCANDYMADIAADTFQSPVFRYVVTSWPSKPVHILGMPFPSSYSFHMWDVFAFFGVIKDCVKPPSDSDFQFQANVQAEVLSFVHNGSPKTVWWKPFPDTTALLSGNTTFTAGYHRQECNYWLEKGFFSYAWIN